MNELSRFSRKARRSTPALRRKPILLSVFIWVLFCGGMEGFAFSPKTNSPAPKAEEKATQLPAQEPSESPAPQTAPPSEASPVPSTSPVTEAVTENPTPAKQKKDPTQAAEASKSSQQAPEVRVPSPSPTPKPVTEVKPIEIPELLKQVEDRYQTGKTLRAHFEQKEYIASTGRIKTTQGTIEIKRPSRIRWETRTPDPSLLVSDGKTFWFYTPPFDEGERGQVVEKKASQVQSKLAQTLISGSFSLARDLRIEPIDPTHYRLVPKKGTAGTVRAAEITVDLQKHEISEVKLEHRGGNRSEIKLSQISIGTELPDPLFHFIVPPNTDRMETE